MTHVGDHPTPEMYQSGGDLDCQCARCGSSVDFARCEALGCGGDGFDDDDEPCDYCDGRGGWHCCLSSPEWCEANPLPGREDVPRGAIEWYTIEREAQPCSSQP